MTTFDHRKPVTIGKQMDAVTRRLGRLDNYGPGELARMAADMPVQQYCYDPSHAMPCPLPCEACEADRMQTRASSQLTRPTWKDEKDAR